MTWPGERPPPPPINTKGAERETLRQFLDYYRAALLDRAWGLDDEQLRTVVAPSTLSLARLIGHMILVEETWFSVRFDGEEPAPESLALDFESDQDAEMTAAEALSPDELLARFNARVADSRAREAAADDLDQVSAQGHPGTGEHWNLRWIMVHMIEEYARHCGHADYIREAIDGDTAG